MNSKATILTLLTCLVLAPQGYAADSEDRESVDGWKQPTSREVGAFYNECGAPSRQIRSHAELICLQSQISELITLINLDKFGYEISKLRSNDSDFEKTTIDKWVEECYQYRARNNPNGGMGIKTGCESFMNSRMTVLKKEAGKLPAQKATKKDTPLKAERVLEEKMIIQNDALLAYESKYKPANKNKAFAQSPNGTWAYASNHTNIDAVKERVLNDCNQFDQSKLDTCTIININDEWIYEQKNR
ncbi:MAG: hypothetical protein K2Q15_02060 [Burkholderiales bacterium]|nr:hypothetical protein [Burkholderiales bacterium]